VARGAQATGSLAELPDVVARVRRAVGAVGTYNPANRPPMEFSASGFFIDAHGHFVTANHVLEGIAERKRVEDLRVFLPGDSDRRGHPAVIVAREPKYDLALLAVEEPSVQALAIGDSTQVREGQLVALCGFPFGFLYGLNPSTSLGIISSISPRAVPAVNTRLLDPATIEALRSPYDVFQLDATAYPGHSGGPLFDIRTGEVLGVVNSAFIKKTKEKVVASGISYAMPIHYVKKAFEDALKKAPGPEKKPGPDEKPER
jgi:S1-C subfamily serine protease